MESRVGHMSAATVDKKAAEMRRRAEALRANLRRRKADRPTDSKTASDGSAQDDRTRG